MGNSATGLVTLSACLGAMFWTGGCATPVPRRVITWELAHAVEIRQSLQWRHRLADGQSVPPEFCNTLSDEFTLFHIRTHRDWQHFGRSTGLFRNQLPTLDLSQGSVVGIVARVGERTDGIWPIAFDEVRVDHRQGWVRFHFASGLYHQVVCPPYLIAAYIPDLADIQVVQINGRVFVISGLIPIDETPSHI